ncbi:hypothetical protein E4T56_gene3345 [Termitomyces sp. T112]|nr:hypothetical protein E4T56_gene3345 [Termitomyces sp. T112]
MPGYKRRTLHPPNSPLPRSQCLHLTPRTTPSVTQPTPMADPYWKIPMPPSTQAFYTPSISQEIPPGWRCPPTFHTNGNNPRINPGGYSTAPPNPAYLPPAHYYAYPIPAAAPVPPEPMDNYSPPPAHRLPLKLLLLLGSKGSKPTPSNATKSSASSTCPPQNLQGIPTPSSPT